MPTVSSSATFVFGLALSILVTDVACAESRAARNLTSALQSVVSVLPEWPSDAQRIEEPEASGVVVQDGHIIATAAHVVAKAISLRVRTSDGDILDAKLIAIDKPTDLAALRIEQALPAIEFADAPVELGTQVCTIGNAFGLGLSLTCGVVSGINRAGVGFNEIEDFIQTDASVNPGASGGALVTRDGNFVGLLSAIFTKSSDANIGVNFAVSAALVTWVMEELVKTGRVTRVLSGLRLGRSFNRLATGKLAARIVLVRPASPAARAGLKPGDLIVRAGGRRIRKPADFRSVMNAQPPPFTLPLRVLRDGRRRKLNMKVERVRGLQLGTPSHGVEKSGQ